MGSIRRRILFALIFAEIAAGLLTAWASFYTAKDEFSQFLDSELEQLAIAMANRGDIPPSSLTIPSRSPNHQVLVQVYESRSNSLFISEKARPLPILVSKGFSTIRRNDEEWRIFMTTAGDEIIEVGEPVSVRTSLAVNASLKILQPLLILLPLTAVIIWLVVGEGLAPLDRTARSVASRSPESLTPLGTKGLPEELKALVTAINSLMERLSVSLDSQKRFASDAAHELRTPLTAIKLQAQLARRARTPEALDRALGRLDEGISRATRLIEQLLIIARLDPDAARHPFESVPLGSLLLTVQHDLEPIASGKQITVDAEPSDAEAFGMRDALLLMVTNLADNALKYTPEGGRIVLSSASEGNSVFIRVADNGPGIPVKDRKRIFERFYRALGTHVPGNGLGLAIVQRIVELHHGTIEVKDGLDGRGTTMEIRLPVRA
ncbi:MAG: ATP-binding protein [Sutterellaceae bacterium]|nr:ATP-binding protein [Sutterellaceae bacterium]MDD7442831.1 ATP-binding protein [Sutterellaceae bacterium]MDY2869255.1 ATP-binding protein [Mesosutterella sp.]